MATSPGIPIDLNVKLGSFDRFLNVDSQQQKSKMLGRGYPQ